MKITGTPDIKPIIPSFRLRILDDQQLGDLQAATLEILQQVGFHCPSQKALDIFAQGGAQIDIDNQIVKLPEQVVMDAMSHAPRFYSMGGRVPKFDLKLDGKKLYCATDGCGVETVDFKTGQRRLSKKSDVANTARMADYLSSMGFYWPMVSAQDFGATAPLHELDASFNNTLKHVQTPTVLGEQLAKYSVEMAKVIAGDESTMRARPPLSLLICTIAPLAFDIEATEAALVYAEAGLPVGIMSMASAGSTAPATSAGTLVVGDAEIVASMVLIQLAYPGAPVYHSMMPGIMHPFTGDFSGGAWEASMLYPLGVELAHMWGVPTLAGIGTEADTSGWQASFGIDASMLLIALCGAETASGLGLRETCTLLTKEALVLDSEIYHQVRIDAQGLDTSQQSIALDVIKSVGPRGHFLREKHTREFMRKIEFSEITDQLDPLGGFRDPIEVAEEKTDWILENHYPEPLDPSKKLELERILQAAEGEIK
jgi:trimethylamine--corrinoid protein Co-methyltransferase